MRLYSAETMKIRADSLRRFGIPIAFYGRHRSARLATMYFYFFSKCLRAPQASAGPRLCPAVEGLVYVGSLLSITELVHTYQSRGVAWGHCLLIELSHYPKVPLALMPRRYCKGCKHGSILASMSLLRHIKLRTRNEFLDCGTARVR